MKKDKSTLVSVIIPTYNRGKPLCQTLSSLLAQNYPDFEIIVVDQSTQRFPEKEAFLKKNRSKLTYLTLKKANASLARNQGIKRAKGEILLFLDDDVICRPDLIATHVRAYQDKTVGAVAGRVITPGQKSELNKKKVGQISWLGKFSNGFSSTITQEVETAITCNASWRKSALEKIGCFDENYTGPIREDSDLSLRTIKAGYRILFVPGAKVIHQRAVSGGFRKDKDRLRWYFGFFKSETYFFLKHRPKVLLPLILATRWQWFLRCMFGFGREVSWRSITTPWRGIKAGIKSYQKYKDENRS